MFKVAIIVGDPPRPKGRGGRTLGLRHCRPARAMLRSKSSTSRTSICRSSTRPLPPSMGQYSQPHTKAWAAKIATFDAFVFVTPEYNHSTSGALKNAIDYLFREWNDKAAGFVGYGGMSGVRAVEQLRLIMGELKIADVRAQVGLSLFTDFENFSTFKPAAHQEATVNAMLDDLIPWARALQAMRVQRAEREEL